MPFLNLASVSIDFPVFGHFAHSLKRTIASSVTGGAIGTETGVTTVHALADVTLRIAEGERVGIMGHNGSGKTTLLRTLAGVYPPTRGTFTCDGTVASLIDPSLGIEQELNGYENIELRGALIGLPPHVMKGLVPDIEAFSELGEYLAMPLRTYSTGMLMRLVFAIATAMRADILLMDEWLSVGDAGFREKAEQRLRDVVQESGILVLASHSEQLIAKECNRIVVLEHGRIIRDEPL